MDEQLQQMQQQLMPQLSQNQTFQNNPALLQMTEWLLANPSIPLELRKQFMFLWEIVVFGNYDDHDRKYLQLQFNEWVILTLMSIPDKEWGYLKEYKEPDSEGGTTSLSFDLNVLFNMLRQAYYIQLTRGKDGFTVKEMTSVRDIKRIEDGSSNKKASFWGIK